MTICAHCEKPVPVKPMGPVPDYCSRACRSRAYEERKRQRMAAELGAELTIRLGDRYGVVDGDIVEWVKAQALAMGRLR